MDIDSLHVLVLDLAKRICGFILLLIFLATASITANYYNSSFAYVEPIRKGKIQNSSAIYDCVIPKSSVSENGEVMFARPLKTVMGQRYSVVSEYVEILAEDGDRCAVSSFYADGDYMTVRILENVPANNNTVLTQAQLCPIEAAGDNDLLILETSGDGSELFIKINDCGIPNSFETSSSENSDGGTVFYVRSKAEYISFIAQAVEDEFGEELTVTKVYEKNQKANAHLLIIISAAVSLVLLISSLFFKKIILELFLKLLSWSALIFCAGYLPYISKVPPKIDVIYIVFICYAVLYFSASRIKTNTKVKKQKTV